MTQPQLPSHHMHLGRHIASIYPIELRLRVSNPFCKRLTWRMESKRRKIEGGAISSPVASLVLEGFDSEILASHKQTDAFKVPGGLTCIDHSFRTALDYSGEVRDVILEI